MIFSDVEDLGMSDRHSFVIGARMGHPGPLSNTVSAGTYPNTGRKPCDGSVSDALVRIVPVGLRQRL